MHPTKEHAKHHSISWRFLVSIVEFETSPKKWIKRETNVSSTNQKKATDLKAFPLDVSKESDSDTGEASPSASPDVEASEAASPEAVPQVEVPPAPVEAAGGNVRGVIAFFAGREGKTRHPQEKSDVCYSFGEVKLYEWIYSIWISSIQLFNDCVDESLFE